MLSIFCGVSKFTRKKFFMAMLAFKDDSHFEREAEIAILRFSRSRKGRYW
jgi:Na+/H+ antiporter NhaA